MHHIYTVSKDGKSAVIDSGEIPHIEASFAFIPVGDPEICADINAVFPEVRKQRVNSSDELALPLQIALEELGYTFSRKMTGEIVYPPGDLRFDK